jgi:hypothetical protein
MAKRKKSRRSSFVHTLAEGVGSAASVLIGHTRLLTHVLAVVVAAAGLWWGLGRLEDHVWSLPEFQQPVRVEIENRPSWLDETHVSEILSGLPNRSILDTELVAEVADHVARNGWIARVNRVKKCAGATIRVECEFRQPVAVVQRDSFYYLVDGEGVRLPGRYSEPGSYLIVQGVERAAPMPGEPWQADDLRAGLRLAGLVLAESFAEQIGSVQVHNFHGRQRPSEAHLTLLTRPEGPRSGWGRVLWGSTPGEEIEEPTADEKIQLLRANYLQCGRVDAGAPWIDVSIRSGEYRRSAGVKAGVS